MSERQKLSVGLLRLVVTKFWRGLSLQWRLSVILAGIAALFLIGVALFGPPEAHLGAAIGLFGLLIAVQAVILLFIFVGDSSEHNPPVETPPSQGNKTN